MPNLRARKPLGSYKEPSDDFEEGYLSGETQRRTPSKRTNRASLSDDTDDEDSHRPPKSSSRQKKKYYSDTDQQSDEDERASHKYYNSSSRYSTRRGVVKQLDQSMSTPSRSRDKRTDRYHADDDEVDGRRRSKRLRVQEHEFSESPPRRMTRNSSKTMDIKEEEPKDKQPEEEEEDAEAERAEQEEGEQAQDEANAQEEPQQQQQQHEDEEEEEEEEEEGDDDGPKQYKLRQRKPVNYVIPTLQSSPVKESVVDRAREQRGRKHLGRSWPRRSITQHFHANVDSSDEENDRKRYRGNHASQRSTKDAIISSHQAPSDIDPVGTGHVDFSAVGGLDHHVNALKEMVMLPLLYPEIYEKFDIAPPRGVLFYGPPGTGKTLMARALTNSCSQNGKKVTFFMRKGADCLSKWVGEAERQLRLLFEQAATMQPSIIFFDEIDGLAPVRSAKQEQIHSSIVSTLLALMDGLDARGQIVVIGATNRLDAIDPALRRPGRFDREFLFPLPDRDARRRIIEIHTAKWQPQLAEHFKDELADITKGYCGADIKALVAEAALHAVRRHYPEIYASPDKLLLQPDLIKIDRRDFSAAARALVPAAKRAAPIAAGSPLSTLLEPLLRRHVAHVTSMIHDLLGNQQTMTATLLGDDDDHPDDIADLRSIFAGGGGGDVSTMNAPVVRRLPNTPTVYRPRLLVCGPPGNAMVAIGAAILHHMAPLPVQSLDMATLLSDPTRTPESVLVSVVQEKSLRPPCLIYIPLIEQWWESAGAGLRSALLSALAAIAPDAPVLLMATADEPFHALPKQIKQLFMMLNTSQVYDAAEHSVTTPEERRQFFAPLIAELKAPPKGYVIDDQGLLQGKVKVSRDVRVLPKAPPPPPRKFTPLELEAQRREEEVHLLRLSSDLRFILDELFKNPKFRLFSRPVDREQVPDYYDIIHQPMDLWTMQNRLNEGRYWCLADFVEDIDQIWANAVKYHENHFDDARIVSRAYALKEQVRLTSHYMDEEIIRATDAIALRRAPERKKEPEIQATRASLRIRGFEPEPVVTESTSPALSVPEEDASRHDDDDDTNSLSKRRRRGGKKPANDNAKEADGLEEEDVLVMMDQQLPFQIPSAAQPDRVILADQIHLEENQTVPLSAPITKLDEPVVTVPPPKPPLEGRLFIEGQVDDFYDDLVNQSASWSIEHILALQSNLARQVQLLAPKLCDRTELIVQMRKTLSKPLPTESEDDVIVE